MIEREQTVRIKQIDEEKHLVYGEVYAPFQLDTYGEFMLPEDIEKIAHRFMQLELSQSIDTNHDNQPNGSYPVESFVARDSDPDFTEGAWVLGVKVENEDIWSKVKSGEINGFSLEAMVKPVEYEVRLSVIRDHLGETEDSNDHNHVFFLSVDELGRVVGGHTDEVNGHSHAIRKASVTERSKDGHSHRFFL